ncbi:DUF1351 domain-containing protein [Collinsella aerofaciens]|uniref:DUF1351 domain-containing protein n=1 Tax=Collinsella aerofaciens TaxID=74426 RepID=UPI00232FFFAE|nr:DUF1351 domain-containing protein [Collinsella aerofaciens]MDB1907663.1 DUF1351 domain-containing protein [Collinsella aerofaciens]
MAGENGAEEVIAEVIEEQEASDLVVTYSPSVISANFDALEAHVRAKVADYEGAKYDLTKDDSIKEAKHDRSYLNGLKSEIEERRKAVKREYNKPLAAFEKRCKEITSIIDGASDGIKAQLDEADERRKAGARAALEAHYREFAELLSPVVPYERLHDDRWLNKSFGEAKAKKALEDKVSAVARDWDTLKAQRDSMAHYEVAERELFRTLDLGSALNAARAADDEDARIAAMREAVESKPAPRPAPRRQAEPAAAARPELSCAWTVEIPFATRSQMELLAAALRERGITGTIKCKGVR